VSDERLWAVRLCTGQIEIHDAFKAEVRERGQLVLIGPNGGIVGAFGAGEWAAFGQCDRDGERLTLREVVVTGRSRPPRRPVNTPPRGGQ